MHKLIFDHKLTIFLLIFNMSYSAQSLKKICVADSTFIYFSKRKGEQFKSIYINPKTNLENRIYSYKIKDSIIPGNNPSFTYEGNNIFFIKSNKFLKKKRKLIINYDYYKKNEKEIVKELLKRKPTFIIDEEELKNEKIILRQVVFIEIYNQFPIE